MTLHTTFRPNLRLPRHLAIAVITIAAFFCTSVASTHAAVTLAADLAVDYDNKFQFYWNAPVGWISSVPGPNNTGDMTTGALLDLSSHRPLIQVSTAPTRYTADGDADSTGTHSTPANYLSINDGGSSINAHPGRGKNQQASGAGIDRYVITSFTVDAFGEYSIQNSYVRTNSTDSGGVEVQVFYYDASTETVNVVSSITTTPNTNTNVNFDFNIGWLDVGDRIFVAYGPNLSDSSDGFTSNYQLVYSVPEPSKLMLSLAALSALVLRRRRNLV